MEIEEMSLSDKMPEECKTIRLLVELPEVLKRLKVQGFENGFHVLFTAFAELCLKSIIAKYKNSMEPEEELQLIENDFKIIEPKLNALVGNTVLIREELIKNIEFALVENNFLESNISIGTYNDTHLTLNVIKNVSVTSMIEREILIPVPESIRGNVINNHSREELDGLTKVMSSIVREYNENKHQLDELLNSFYILDFVALIPDTYKISADDIRKILMSIKERSIETGNDVDEFMELKMIDELNIYLTAVKIQLK